MAGFKHTEVKKGDLIKSSDWNAFGTALDDVYNTAISIGGDKIFTGSLSVTGTLGVDGNTTAGNLEMGHLEHGTEWPGIKNKNSSQYALIQNSTGLNTLINKKSGGGYIGFRVDNATKISINDTGNLGIGTTDAAAPLSIRAGGGKESHPDESMHMTNDSILFGGKNSGKEAHSASITAGKHDANSLCIIGMSSETSAADRRISMWAEGGLSVNGKMGVNTTAALRADLDVPRGGVFNHIAIGCLPHGAGSPYPYETIQLNAAHNLRIYFGANERFLFGSNGNLTVEGSVEIKGGLTMDGKAVIDNDGGWHRTYGSTGWYNGTHDGGWYMNDTAWIKSYGGKPVYCDKAIRADGGFQVDGKTVIDADAGWHRSYNNTGWYNGTHGGGWYMSDGSWIRSYGGKHVYCDNIIRADGGFQVDGKTVINGSGGLDIPDVFSAVVRCADLYIGHSSRHGGTGRALVDNGDVLHINHGADWKDGVVTYGDLTVNGSVKATGWVGSQGSAQAVGGWRLGKWPTHGSGNTWVYLSRYDQAKYQDLAVGCLWAGGAQRFGTADDLAEMTPVNPDDKLESGEVVIIDDYDSVRLTRCTKAGDPMMAGVISDTATAGLIIGGSMPGDDKKADIKPLALAGRVMTKVTLEGGPIKAGDFLTAAHTPGCAMKAEGPCHTLGKAMQSFTGSDGEQNGKIWVLVNLSYING